MSDPVGYLEKLIITQGAGVGRPMQLLHWQKRLLRMLETPGDVACHHGARRGKDPPIVPRWGACYHRRSVAAAAWRNPGGRLLLPTGAG